MAPRRRALVRRRPRRGGGPGGGRPRHPRAAPAGHYRVGRGHRLRQPDRLRLLERGPTPRGAPAPTEPRGRPGHVTPGDLRIPTIEDWADVHQLVELAERIAEEEGSAAALLRARGLRRDEVPEARLLAGLLFGEVALAGDSTADRAL